jgi:error-prone DNA polymerase
MVARLVGLNGRKQAVFSELLVRSNYSFLRGASHPEELVEQAAALGYGALAIVDKDGVYGLAKAWFKARKHPGLKFIAGAELSLEHGGSRGGLALLARNKAGWSLLCRLLSASHTGKPKGRAGLAWDDFLAMTEAHPGRAGLLALPRGAGLGEAFLEEACPSPMEEGPAGDEIYARLKALFGASLFIPVGRFLDGLDAGRTAAARSLCARHGLEPLATSDAHYHEPGRRALHDALACVRERCSLESAGWRLFSNAERRLKSTEEMGRLFADWPEALAGAAAAATSCAFDLSELRYRYPSEWIPAGATAQSHLARLAVEGAAGRYPMGVPDDVRRQLDHELAMVERLGFADYFLTIHEMVVFARGRRILCQGRGSAANSALCWCLGITSVDPVRGGLLFERFLSEERAEPPDIDVDFEHERREEVIRHLYEKYGRERAAMVSAVIKYRSRSAVADLSKALGAPMRAEGPHGDARAVPLGRDADMGRAGAPPGLEALVEQVGDFPRHLSIHSGGFVLSGEPLIDLVPIEPARMEGRSIVQWDKYDLDYLGLMKVDVLALGMLSALRRGLDLLGLEELSDIPAEDPGTYAMIQRADTLGVFQIESRAQMNMLGRLRPENFYDLVIEVAIVRPGPIVGQMVHPYLRRRKGEEKVTYEHPALERILGKTLGVPLFQEQVMRIAQELAGFSPGEADELRRAISSWRADGRWNSMQGRLEKGLKAGGLSDAFCASLFAEIKGFAEYGFPESHAASFALLVYASCWMKHAHPAEFACALLNAQPMGFYAAHSLVDDAKRHGVGVRALDIHSALWDCAIVGGELRLGWRMVEGMAETRARRLLAEREARPFAGLEDFVRRAGLPSAVLRRLALAGAFSVFGLDERAALWGLLSMEALAQNAGAAQLGLDLAPGTGAAPDFVRPTEGESVRADYLAWGLSTRAHPMRVLRALQARPCRPLAQIRGEGRHGLRVRADGMLIVRQKPGTAKGVVFATLEDESGLLDLVLWPDVYERLRPVLLGEAFLRVDGVLQRDRDSVSVLVKNLRGLRWGDEGGGLGLQSHDWH